MDKLIDKLFDKYAWQARGRPALLVLLPVIIAVIAWMPKVEDAVKPLLSIVSGTGALLLLAHVARSAGKRAEETLKEEWGAMPSTIMLRHADSKIDSVTKKRYHAALGKLVKEAKLPSPEQEKADPKSADQVYAACATYLRAHTRDQKKFALLYAENIDYGYRRNLYGMRRIGVVLTLLGCLGCALKLLRDHKTGTVTSSLAVVCLLGCAALAYVWTIFVNKEWVRQAADAFSFRLFEAIEHLRGTNKSASAATEKTKDGALPKAKP